MVHDILYDYPDTRTFIAEGYSRPEPDGMPMDIRILNLYDSGIRAKKTTISPMIVVKLGTKLYLIFDSSAQKYFYLHQGSPLRSYPYGYVGKADRIPILGKPFGFHSILSFGSPSRKSFRPLNFVRMEKVIEIIPVGKSFYNVKGTIHKAGRIYTISAYVKV